MISSKMCKNAEPNAEHVLTFLHPILICRVAYILSTGGVALSTNWLLASSGPLLFWLRPWSHLSTARDQEDQPSRTRFRVLDILLIWYVKKTSQNLSGVIPTTGHCPDSYYYAYFLLSFGRTAKLVHKWDQTRLQTSRQCFWQGLFRGCFVWRSSSRLLVVVVVVVVADYCGSCSIMTIIITERVCVLSVNRQRPGKRPVTSEISCVQVEVAKGSLTGIYSIGRSFLYAWAGLISALLGILSLFWVLLE
jgi:hypothetical protein